MPSETDCVNDALGQIGAATITALDDGSVNANHAQRFYLPLLDAQLTLTHWSFAKERAELAQDAIKPLFEFAFAYTLPVDPFCLKVIEYNGANLDTSNLSLFEAATRFRFKVEGRKILTNDGVVKILYLARRTDPNVWSGLFYQGMAALLGSKLARAIPKDEKKAQELQAAGLNWISLAAAVDGQQGSVEPHLVDDLLWGR